MIVHNTSVLLDPPITSRSDLEIPENIKNVDIINIFKRKRDPQKGKLSFNFDSKMKIFLNVSESENYQSMFSWE